MDARPILELDVKFLDARPELFVFTGDNVAHNRDSQ